MVARLPVKYLRAFPKSKQVKNVATTLTRLNTIVAFHDSNKSALKPLRDVSISGFECETSDRWRLKCHPVLCSYVADISEKEDLLST